VRACKIAANRMKVAFVGDQSRQLMIAATCSANEWEKVQPQAEAASGNNGETNYHARSILADEQLRMEAQVRLSVTSNKFYTALIKEYFSNVWPTMETPWIRRDDMGKLLRLTGVLDVS
jgi:hypothetical protein